MEKAMKNFCSTRGGRVTLFFFFFFSIEWKFLIYRNRTEALNFREPIIVTKREPYPGEYVSLAISFIKGWPINRYPVSISERYRVSFRNNRGLISRSLNVNRKINSLSKKYIYTRKKIVSPYLLIFSFERERESKIHRIIFPPGVTQSWSFIPSSSLFSNTGDHFKEIFKAIPYLFDLFEIIPEERKREREEGTRILSG